MWKQPEQQSANINNNFQKNPRTLCRPGDTKGYTATLGFRRRKQWSTATCSLRSAVIACQQHIVFYISTSQNMPKQLVRQNIWMFWDKCLISPYRIHIFLKIPRGFNMCHSRSMGSSGDPPGMSSFPSLSGHQLAEWMPSAGSQPWSWRKWFRLQASCGMWLYVAYMWLCGWLRWRCVHLVSDKNDKRYVECTLIGCV